MRYLRPRRHGLLLAWALAWAGPVEQDLQNLLAPLIAARNEGRVGQVAGSVVLKPKTPQGSAMPLPGAVVVLVPRSPTLVSDLEQVKTKARESEAGYLGAVTGVTQLRERSEQALFEAGAGDLVFSGTSDAGGGFVFSRVPVGEWLLLGRHETFHRLRVRGPSPRERKDFVLGPLPVGYRAVTYWLVPVSVAEGDVVRIDLTDRNLWLRGVAQERESLRGP